MVGGLNKFREAFRRFTDNFVIIGGTACDEVLTDTDMSPRTTLDIDIIVIVENMTAEFATAFWSFIADGKYRPGVRKDKEGQPRYVLYSFDNGAPGYPVKIELLSHHNEAFVNASHIEPLPIDGVVSSLSTIILDEPYYKLTINNSFVSDGLRFATPVALMALKMKAYLNLIAERESGRKVNSKDILKHRNDVLKLAAATTLGEAVKVEPEVLSAISEFQDKINGSLPSQSIQDALGLPQIAVERVVGILTNFFAGL